MNRRYLLDSLHGLKALAFRLLPSEISGLIACVPMTTDGPWTETEAGINNVPPCRRGTGF